MRDQSLIEFVDLAVAYLDGRATDSQVTDLCAQLESDPAKRDLFIDLSLTPDLIREAHEADSPCEAVPVEAGVRSRTPAPAPTIPDSYVYATAALVAIATAIVGVYLYVSSLPQSDLPDPASNQPLANLIENASEGTLTTPGGFISEGRDYPRGEYTLDTGTAEFMLTNSVNVKLRGDTRMVMRNNMNVALTRGTAEFVCPKDATGFTVHLPDGSRVIDLGTAFRVVIDEQGKGRVIVTDGEVELVVGEHRQKLTAGQGSGIANRTIVLLDPKEVGKYLRPGKLAARYSFGGNGDDLAEGRAGVIGANVTFTAGVIGQAAQFPASAGSDDDIIVVPQANAFDPGTGDFSVAFWIDRDTTGLAGIFDALADKGVGYQALFGTGGDLDKLLFRLDGSTTHVVIKSDSLFTDLVGFHHYVVTIDRTPGAEEARIYFDGVLDTTFDISALADADALTPDQDLWIGRFSKGAGLGGKLEDLRFYRSALGEDQVRELFEARHAPTSPDNPNSDSDESL